MQILCPIGCGVEIENKTVLVARHREKLCRLCEFCGQQETTARKRIRHEKMCKMASVEEKKRYVKEIKKVEKKREAIQAAHLAKPEIRSTLLKRSNRRQA